MKKLEVELFKTPYYLIENPQGSGFLYSFVSAPKDNNRQLFPWIKCRDYLQDVIQTHITGKSCLVYGFSYSKGKNPPLDMRRTRLLVTKAGANEENVKNFKCEIDYSLRLIHHFEDIMEIKHTKIQRVSNLERPTWLFNGNNAWLKSPALISLYSLLIRLGYHRIEFDTHQDLIQTLGNLRTSSKSKYLPYDGDAVYMLAIASKITTIAKNYKEIFGLKSGKMGSSYDPTYREERPIRSFHNSSGIYSLCRYDSTISGVIADGVVVTKMNEIAAGKIEALMATN